jgi:hypothetical protein
MDVTAWLRSLGLEQYEAAFRDNAIEPDLLPKLTGEDLKELGVGLVGHRANCSMPSPRCAAPLGSPSASRSTGRHLPRRRSMRSANGGR